MSVNLSGYRAIQNALFVRLDIQGYDVLKFTDLGRSYTINGELYTNVGSLLSVTGTTTEIKATENELLVGISGIPTNSVAEILYNNPKGSSILVTRAFFQPQTGELLNIGGNPAIKYKGFVSNYSMTEQWDFQTQTASHTITFNCSSVISILSKKTTGRRTNPYDEQRFFPGDVSMGRVPTISNSNFQFGAPPGTTS
mgnify:CR=1 FL=1|tara:strand:+ start:10225 stop:10815 length:591 start_codon:yes stop_codon:yes gene_type:complete